MVQKWACIQDKCSKATMFIWKEESLMKILAADGIAKKGIELLQKDFEVDVKDKLPAEELLEIIMTTSDNHEAIDTIRRFARSSRLSVRTIPT